MSETGPIAPPRQRRRTRSREWIANKTWGTRVELISVLIISIASLAAAWSGFQATSWNGVQSELYSQANAVRMESVRVSSSADARLTVEVLLFNGWAEAYLRGDAKSMEFLRNRMEPETQDALDTWIASQPLTNPDAPREPFAVDGFVLADQVRAAELAERALTLVDEGQMANRNGDRYVLSTVLLAIVLFFAGLSSKLGWKPAQAFALGVSGLLLVGILIEVALAPIA